MFFKKFEFNQLADFSYLRVKSNLSSYSWLISVNGIFLLFILAYSNSGIFIRNCLFGLSFFFLAYWVVSIFTYLFKKARFGTFTRMIQRFWKRSLYLFWLLEIGLFMIYLYLSLISPQEVAYMLDNTQLLLSYGTDLLSFFKTLLRPLFILLIANLYLLNHKYNGSKITITSLLTLLLASGLYEDFIQFYAINQHYSNYSWLHTSIENSNNVTIRNGYIGVWEQELAELKLRPFIHYMYLLVFLKLWHTLFIVYFFLFFENARLFSNNTSFNAISANIQNFYFLMFFSYILKISLIKYYLNYLGSFVYYWFYTNPNAYDMGYVYALFSVKYVFFIFNDFINVL